MTKIVFLEWWAYLQRKIIAHHKHRRLPAKKSLKVIDPLIRTHWHDELFDFIFDFSSLIIEFLVIQARSFLFVKIEFMLVVFPILISWTIIDKFDLMVDRRELFQVKARKNQLKPSFEPVIV